MMIIEQLMIIKAFWNEGPKNLRFLNHHVVHFEQEILFTYSGVIMHRIINSDQRFEKITQWSRLLPFLSMNPMIFIAMIASTIMIILSMTVPNSSGAVGREWCAEEEDENDFWTFEMIFGVVIIVGVPIIYLLNRKVIGKVRDPNSSRNKNLGYPANSSSGNASSRDFMIRILKEELEGAPRQSIAHGPDHHIRVMRRSLHMADLLTKGTNAYIDREVLMIAALLHDVDQAYDAKMNHAERSAVRAGEILRGVGSSDEKIERIQNVIREHSSEDGGPPKTWEGKILFDADKLDGLGVIGIMRVFQLCGQMGLSHQDTITWYERKIRKALPLLQTQIAWNMGVEDHEYVRTFIDRFKQHLAFPISKLERDFSTRAIREEDKAWIQRTLEEYWFSPEIVTRGRVHHADELPGFIAERYGKRIGLIVWIRERDRCEVISLTSLEEGGEWGPRFWRWWSWKPESGNVKRSEQLPPMTISMLSYSIFD